MDIPAQINLVVHIVQIAFVLKLTGIVLLLLWFLQQFFGERTAVGFALRVEAAAGIAIPIPRAANTAAVLDASHFSPCSRKR